MMKQDADDESLAKYKASLGLSEDAVKPLDDSIKESVFFTGFKLEYGAEEDKTENIVDVKNSKDIQFQVKQGAKYRLVAKFGVQREMVQRINMVVKFKKGILPAMTEEYVVG